MSVTRPGRTAIPTRRAAMPGVAPLPPAGPGRMRGGMQAGRSGRAGYGF
ncbi:hypothetical protein [Komagataeibacter swingsii]|nr:hypothetical protein [Komagataeibacter swingsii]